MARTGHSSIEPLVVEAADSGSRLQDYLAGAHPEVDRVLLRRLCQDGLVTVNGGEANGRTKLIVGDLVLIDLPDGMEELPRRRSSTAGSGVPPVLAENGFCVVVDKPSGLPTLRDRAGHQGLHGALAEIRPGEDLRIAHRLDRDTSGCLALARGLEGARWLDIQFRAGTVEKVYLALVEGVVGRDQFSVAKPLGPDRKRPGKVAVVKAGSRGAREAHTDVAVLERFRSHTMLEVRPRTGRSHQIRVHLRSAGHPIVADTDYGASGPLLLSALKGSYKLRTGARETPLLSRMFLHAARLSIPTPDGSERLVVESPLPDDLVRALEKLRRFAPRRDGDSR